MATDVVGSRMRALNGPGQNGYQGPSSDLPGQRTNVGFEASKGNAFVPTDDWQTRKVGPNVRTHPQCTGASAGPRVPSKIVGKSEAEND